MRDVAPIEDAVAFVRGHPEMFFPGSTPNPLTCIQHLVVEVLALGACDVRVQGIEGWWVLSSTFDWLAGSDCHEAFQRLLPIPVVGPNASRVEIVVRAFGESVATYGTNTGRQVVSGQEPSEQVWSEMTRGNRAVAFRFP